MPTPTRFFRIITSMKFENLLSMRSLAVAASVAVFAVLFSIQIGWSPRITFVVYLLGGNLFIHGSDPYALTLLNGISNQFKYSPLFALGMGWMDLIRPVEFAVVLWLNVSTWIFAFGLSRWLTNEQVKDKWIWICLWAVALNFYESQHANQANVLIAGMILWGMADYRDGKFLSAGCIFLVATNLKVYPAIFLFALLLRPNRDYMRGILISGAIVFLLPAFFVGWAHNWNMHMAWANLVLHETNGVEILNLKSSFSRIGLKNLGTSLSVVILCVSSPLLLGYAWIKQSMDWRPWLGLGCSALVLLSPKTEVFTYVILAPVYVLLFTWCLDVVDRAKRRWLASLTMLFSLVAATSRFFVSNWSVSEAPEQIQRVIGALGLWAISVYIVGTLLKNFLEQRWSSLSLDFRR